MPKTIPIYKDHDETYRADSCLPLVEAAARREVRLEALRHGHYPGRRLPSAALSGVKMVGFWDAEDDQSWGLPWHRNEGIEFTFLESGSLRFAVDNREYLLEPDHLTVTRPWQLHRVGNPHVAASRLHWLIIDVGVRRPNQAWKWPPWLLLTQPDLKELTNILRHNEHPVWKATREIRDCHRAISRAVKSDRDGSTVSRLTLRINDLFLLLLEMFRANEIRLDQSLSSSRRTVQLFLADLQAQPEHLALKWTLKGMADSCGLGATQFVHHVRALTNMSPAHFLCHSRLDLASRLLRERREATILDVALECGFSSSQYFATVFARRFGCAPREFERRRPSPPPTAS
ncbi:MAG: AraC family transcriptional regulator [Planctomycetota bacterium]